MPIAPIDSSYVRTLVRDRSAIVLDESKEYLLESRLLPLVRRERLSSIGDLVGQLRSRPYGSLHELVVEAMTTNETSFFRDIHPFEALRHGVIPELIQARASERKLNIWCAACSSGQEPYTIAMLLDHHFPQLAGWDVSILGTDLSGQMLDRAREGAYTKLEVNRGLPAPMLVKYFEAEGLMWRVKKPLRDRIEFKPMNLVGMWPMMPKMDIVFMRNVLIYFDTEVKKTIIGNVRRVLRRDGSFFLGASETPMNLDDAFERKTHGRGGYFQLR